MCVAWGGGFWLQKSGCRAGPGETAVPGEGKEEHPGDRGGVELEEF